MPTHTRSLATSRLSKNKEDDTWSIALTKTFERNRLINLSGAGRGTQVLIVGFGEYQVVYFTEEVLGARRTTQSQGNVKLLLLLQINQKWTLPFNLVF